MSRKIVELPNGSCAVVMPSVIVNDLLQEDKAEVISGNWKIKNEKYKLLIGKRTGRLFAVIAATVN